jgi:UDP-N-acetylmuramoyl-L-alanyl-D-glutamate--2,6-diaminopimelate ligase
MVHKIIKKITPPFFLNCYHFLLALLGAILFGFPSKKMIVIGVTGTNGKSTVVGLTTKILEEAGFKVASLSSIKFKIGQKEWQNRLKMTMPGRLKLQKFLKEALKANCQYVVLEVTSEGIKQHRHRFIDFGLAVITNLRPEHIEAHGSFENYKKAKGELFKALRSQKSKIKSQPSSRAQVEGNYNSKLKNKKVSIVNLDDENAEYFLQFPADEKYGYMIMSNVKCQMSKLQVKCQMLKPEEDLKIVEAKNCQQFEWGTRFLVKGIEFNLKLPGVFNIYNALAAICVGLSQNVSLETIKRALEKAERIPGRMEEVIKEPFRVIVDYAHTPDALENVYKTIHHSLSTNHYSLICVLGACGGGRDKWKRPKLGKIAATYCDKIILTDEDPYDENPLKIIEEIESGFLQTQNPKPARPAGGPARPAGGPETRNCYKILDRREAIKKALELAKPGDTVIITGKGCEPWMCVAGGKKIPWDDREIVRQEYKKLKQL